MFDAERSAGPLALTRATEGFDRRAYGASPRHVAMPMQASEAFCRIVETLDVHLDLYDGNPGGARHWLTLPNIVLTNEQPVDQLITEAGRRTVQHAIHAIEYDLPV